MSHVCVLSCKLKFQTSSLRTTAIFLCSFMFVSVLASSVEVSVILHELIQLHFKLTNYTNKHYLREEAKCLFEVKIQPFF
jgi:hypothetical protein